MADKIMLIRHGEKPADVGRPFGVDPNGDREDQDLTVRGWQRAGALTHLFAPRSAQARDPRLASPRTIFAPDQTGDHPSTRSRHTVAQLAELLSIEIIQQFSIGQEQQLAAAAMNASGPVLIAWRHSQIPDIATRILGSAFTLPPGGWPSLRFDLVWVIDRLAQSGWQFSQVGQFVLAGDRDP